MIHDWGSDMDVFLEWKRANPDPAVEATKAHLARVGAGRREAPAGQQEAVRDVHPTDPDALIQVGMDPGLFGIDPFYGVQREDERRRANGI